MSPEKVALLVVSAVLAVAWVPVGVHFFRSWRRRGSPLSLAICGLIGYPIFINASAAIFLSGQRFVTVKVLVGTNLLLLLNFALCFKWQKERFPDARGRSDRRDSDPPPDYFSNPPRKRLSDFEDETPTPRL